MSLFRKSIAIFAFALTVLYAPSMMVTKASANPQATAKSSCKGQFVIVTSDDSMAQMMSMVLSTQTLNQGRSVRLLLCGKAGELALKGSEETTFKPRNKSPQTLLKGLIARGVKVEVCPLFLPNTGKQPTDLIAGVTVAKPPVIAAAMAEDGIKLLTY